MSNSRGIRNNNPGNIEYNGIDWDGMAEDQKDPRFVVFKDPEWGIRAMAKILINYQKYHNINTIFSAIHRWAPPTENHTAGYASYVAQHSEVGIDDEINFSDPVLLGKIIKAMITMENGSQPYADHVISKGIQMALIPV
jgi:hypothetical protein